MKPEKQGEQDCIDGLPLSHGLSKFFGYQWLLYKKGWEARFYADAEKKWMANNRRHLH